MSDLIVLHSARYLRLVKKGPWELCQRVNATGVVGVIAVTPGGGLLLVEQHRPPVDARVVELPAGLAGDLADDPHEALETAARRELEEETGYTADRFELIADGPVSAGLTDERMHLFLARGVRRVGAGGGDASEDIVVHEVPVDEVWAFLQARRAQGVLFDPKVLTALAVLRAIPALG